MNQKRLNLHQVQYLSLSTATLFSVFVCALVVLYLASTQHKDAVEFAKRQLEQDSLRVARRIESELLVNNPKAVPALAEHFERQEGFSRISLEPQAPNNCQDFPCTLDKDESIFRIYAMETPSGLQFLTVAQLKPSFYSALDLRVILGMIFAIFVLTLGAVFIQRQYTRKHIVGPIENLLSQSTSAETLPAEFPSELVKLADELHQSIENRDKAVYGQLASGVIHDLRTQLHSLTSAVALVSESQKGTEQRLQRLELLNNAAQRNLPRMQKVIEETLDSLKGLNIKPEENDISQTARNAIQDCSALATSRNVKLSWDIQERLLAKHDKIQLERVLSNLITNGIEAVSEHDSTLKQVHVSISRGNGCLEIAVEDSGPGLTVARKDLFKLFKTSKPNGTGLGLVLSKKIVDAHQGRIYSTVSQTLKGAKFAIELPMESEGTA